MTTPLKTDFSRHFVFKDTKNLSEISVDIQEKYSTSYGYHVWPSAPVLAQFVSYFREQFRDKSVIELGSGTGIVGIVAAKVGANVVLTDSDQYPECLQLCRQNVVINGLEDRVRSIEPFTWGQFDDRVIRMPAFDYILSSDCFYDQNDFEDILSSVSFLMDKEPDRRTVFYTTYQERNSDWSIECLLRQWNLECRYISLSDFEADSDSVGGTDLSAKHTIHLLKITRLRRESD